MYCDDLSKLEGQRLSDLKELIDFDDVYYDSKNKQHISRFTLEVVGAGNQFSIYVYDLWGDCIDVLNVTGSCWNVNLSDWAYCLADEYVRPLY